MRFLVFLVILGLIVGGAIYGAQMMGIQIPYVPQFFTNMNMNQNDVHSGHQMQDHQMPTQMPSTFNQLASQNKDKLMQATNILNQAMELITNDPYAQITLPNQPSTTARDNNTSTVTIPPRDGVTINITPGSSKKEFPPNSGSIVYDQSKLEQLHNGIFQFSQAMMLLNELNNDLTDQSVMSENNPPTSDTYAVRYNLIQQNRSKLVHANRLLQESMVMVNVNPYSPAEGYVYNTQKMQQLHQGISELARSALLLSRLSDDLNQQMTQTAYEARLARVQMNNMSGMNMQNGTMTGTDNTWLFNLALVIITFGIVLGVLVLIRRLINDVKTSR